MSTSVKTAKVNDVFWHKRQNSVTRFMREEIDTSLVLGEKAK